MNVYCVKLVQKVGSTFGERNLAYTNTIVWPENFETIRGRLLLICKLERCLDNVGYEVVKFESDSTTASFMHDAYPPLKIDRDSKVANLLCEIIKTPMSIQFGCQVREISPCTVMDEIAKNSSSFSDLSCKLR